MKPPPLLIRPRAQLALLASSPHPPPAHLNHPHQVCRHPPFVVVEYPLHGAIPQRVSPGSIVGLFSIVFFLSSDFRRSYFRSSYYARQMFDGHIFDGRIFDGRIFDARIFDGRIRESCPPYITPMTGHCRCRCLQTKWVK